ncbi:hypothetical protein LZ30DRAFT_795943 [Colletotrichum cereale]|nr:hypothetical protein LZ30DRAFT_795943 [Colletotrichum cereale]
MQESVKNGSAPFRVGWVLSDTTFTIKYLQSGDADVGITYSAAPEKTPPARVSLTQKHTTFSVLIS